MASDLPPTLRWEGEIPGRLLILDQTLLPAEEREIVLATVDDIIDAIRRLAVRGAPAIGVSAAYGVVVASLTGDPADLVPAARRIAAARPTAVNLAWAVDRMLGVVREGRAGADLPARLLAEARRIHEEDRLACEAMAGHAAPLVRDGGAYLTHCNAGALATAGIGTAVGVFHRAARDGKRITVYADETRPLLQGARLTAWELARAGVDVVVQCDSAAATALSRGLVEAVFVGADRIAANGDVANKLGTYPLALAARAHKIPFYVVAPSSTFDLDLASGRDIPIEERDPAEVTMPGGTPSTPEGVRVFNPAFDVTPAGLVTALVTERGLVRPVNAAEVSRTLRA